MALMVLGLVSVPLKFKALPPRKLKILSVWCPFVRIFIVHFFSLSPSNVYVAIACLSVRSVNDKLHLSLL